MLFSYQNLLLLFPFQIFSFLTDVLKNTGIIMLIEFGSK